MLKKIKVIDDNNGLSFDKNINVTQILKQKDFGKIDLHQQHQQNNESNSCFNPIKYHGHHLPQLMNLLNEENYGGNTNQLEEKKCMPINEDKWEWRKFTNKSMRLDYVSINILQHEDEILADNKSWADHITINMPKSFMYSENLGWNWHKGWKLPNIQILLPHFQTKSNSSFIYKAEISTVIFEDNKKKFSEPRRIDLIGDTLKEINQNKIYFSTLKFSTTSHKKNGKKFYLIIELSIHSKADKKSQKLKILNSVISPPIFVDARKATREPRDKKKQRMNRKYFSPFDPQLLSRVFTKRSKYGEETNSACIEDNLQGLCDYLTASNIKNKIKHPLFLLFKFPSCLELYYKEDESKDKDGGEKHVVKKFQNMLNELNSMDQNKLQELQYQMKINPNINDVDFILLIKENGFMNQFYATKTIIDHFEPLKHHKIHILCHTISVPENFKKISNDSIKVSYKEYYKEYLAEAMKTNKCTYHEVQSSGEDSIKEIPTRAYIEENSTASSSNSLCITPLSEKSIKNTPEPKFFSQPLSLAQPFSNLLWVQRGLVLQPNATPKLPPLNHVLNKVQNPIAYQNFMGNLAVQNMLLSQRLLMPLSWETLLKNQLGASRSC